MKLVPLLGQYMHDVHPLSDLPGHGRRITHSGSRCPRFLLQPNLSLHACPRRSSLLWENLTYSPINWKYYLSYDCNNQTFWKEKKLSYLVQRRRWCTVIDPEVHPLFARACYSIRLLRFWSNLGGNPRFMKKIKSLTIMLSNHFETFLIFNFHKWNV